MKKEELLDKYIKYNSKITFDIFKLMYQKLIDLGFTSPHTVENAFKEFSGKYSYFIMILYPDGPFFNQHSLNSTGQSEISVEDLLGYNPFESFKLPEQWYIEVGENAEIINKWKQTTEYTDPASWYTYVTCRGRGYKNKSDYTDHSEITLEQFKQYVLKEPLISKPIKPFPTHWCIKLTKENISIVGAYYNKKHLSDPNLDTYTSKGVIGTYVKSHNNEDEYVKNGYTAYSFFSEPSDSYPEITLEQFKEFVMNEPVKIETIPESKVEESVPEYVECFYSDTDSFIINKIYKCESFSKANALNLNSEIGFKKSLPYKGALWKFKPSTKEAFEAQNKPKFIEKWSAKTYIVCIKDYGIHLKIGDIAQIDGWSGLDRERVDVSKSVNNPCMPFKTYCEWFATKPEAEEFAKTLIYPVKSNGFPIEGCCKSKSSELEQYLIKTRGNSDSKMTKERANGIGWNEISYWWLLDTDKSSKRKYHLSDLNVWLDKPKQPLKQVIHCKTQEEWDFVGKKIGYTFRTIFDSDNINTINPSAKACNARSYYEFRSTQYQILSFQEWCYLNGYKMKKTRFKKGDYVVSLRPKHLSTVSIKYNYCYIQYKDEDKISIDSGTTMYEDNINYARLATPEEIEEYKRIGKPYDVTTLQSPTINTYGLNIGDKLDSIIIAAWETKGFNYFSDSSEGWLFGNGTAYEGNRKIENFKVIDGVVGFLISGNLGIYLRAEGFKEFADNYYTENISNFKVGSWYKYNGYYLKYSKTDNRNIFIASEYINTEDNSFKDDLIDFTCGIADGSKKLVTDLSLIQQYLPEGHPDLVNIVNKEVKGISETSIIRITSREVKRINI